jgi:hypothetical protein
VATNQRRPPVDELLRARAEGRTYTPEQLADRAAQLEAKMAQLKNRYEQFFQGLERKPPSNDRDALHKELEMLRQISTKNTAVKFKLTSLFNRFLAYERLWMRTELDIEEGRYRRDLFKAKLRKKPDSVPSAEDVDMNDFEPDAPKRSSSQSLPGPKEGTGATLSDDRLKKIYEAYLLAKRECREDTDGLTFDRVAQRIRAQIPELVKQANGKSIDFKVVIRDGKAMLRAVARD